MSVYVCVRVIRETDRAGAAVLLYRRTDGSPLVLSVEFWVNCGCKSCLKAVQS